MTMRIKRKANHTKAVSWYIIKAPNLLNSCAQTWAISKWDWPVITIKVQHSNTPTKGCHKHRCNHWKDQAQLAHILNIHRINRSLSLIRLLDSRHTHSTSTQWWTKWNQATKILKAAQAIAIAKNTQANQVVQTNTDHILAQCHKPTTIQTSHTPTLSIHTHSLYKA